MSVSTNIKRERPINTINTNFRLSILRIYIALDLDLPTVEGERTRREDELVVVLIAKQFGFYELLNWTMNNGNEHVCFALITVLLEEWNTRGTVSVINRLEIQTQWIKPRSGHKEINPKVGVCFCRRKDMNCQYNHLWNQNMPFDRGESWISHWAAEAK